MSTDQPTAAIAGFTLVELLGRGAASQVYRARRDGQEPGGGTTEYAVKVLDSDPDRPGHASASLRREAALLAGVDHPGLVTIHEIGEDDGRPYLVMDLVDGEPLSAVLRSGAPLEPERVVRLARDVLGPLAAVHRRGLMHRDLKPDNIMIMPEGAPV